MPFPRKIFANGTTYYKADWDELQNNIGNYYDALIAAIQSNITTVLGDYLTSTHKTEVDPHPNLDMDYIKDGTNYKKLTDTQETNLDTLWAAFGASPSMDNIPQGSSFIKLSAVEKDHCDMIWSAFGASPSMDNIPDGSSYKKLTDTQETNLNTLWAAFGASPSMDNIPQGSSFIKLSAAEYADFLTGFYDILDQVTTVKFGHDREIEGFYFAKGADADGADVYANDLFSRGNPVYTLVYASDWALVASGDNTGPLTHSLSYRPSFGVLQVSAADPTGQPEDYVYTEGYAAAGSSYEASSYAAWNNTYYKVYNWSDNSYYFRVLLFAYLGS